MFVSYCCKGLPLTPTSLVSIEIIMPTSLSYRRSDTFKKYILVRTLTST